MNSYTSYRLDIETTRIAIDMERLGMPIDREYLAGKIELISALIVHQKGALQVMAGINNVGSNDQVIQYLLSTGWRPTTFTKTHKPQVSFEVLTGIDDDWVRSLLDLRKLQKVLGTYLKPIEFYSRDDSRLHPNFKLDRTASGRLATGGNNKGGKKSPLGIPNVNVQNWPRVKEGETDYVRACIAAGDGMVLCKADYSQLELRILAEVAKVPYLIQTFKDGGDAHEATAQAIYGRTSVTKDERYVAKQVNFSVVYGAGPDTLAENAQVDLATAKEVLERINTVMNLDAYRSKCITTMLNTGGIHTVDGRLRLLPAIHSSAYKVRSKAIREGVNHTIQGTAAGIAKRAMVLTAPVGGLFNQVHDELVFEWPQAVAEENMARVVEFMEGAASGILNQVPLRVDAELVERYK